MRLLGVRLRRLFFEDWRVPLAVVAVMASLALFSAVYFYVRIQSEGRERRTQTCTIQESKQAKDVRQLKATYRYLLSLRPDELDDTINVAVLHALTETERDAHLDDAPAFCDEPKIGLPEPDPKIPQRPEALRPPAPPPKP